MTILVTGAAGFIGYHLAERLLASGQRVLGVDSLNAYYDPALKQARLARLQAHPGFTFLKRDLAQADALQECRDQGITQVVHLAAQAGVRYSLEAPFAYADSNLTGQLTVLEFCRHTGLPLIYASSSSVYGVDTHAPFAEDAACEHPVSLYAATKRAGELMADCYTRLYGFSAVGLRFFTVYGPWGRPDMAYFSFTKSILEGAPIAVYNHGEQQRDFTYIDDIIAGILGCMNMLDSRLCGNDVRGQETESALSLASSRFQEETREAKQDAVQQETREANHKIYNLGNHQPVPLLEFIRVIEQACGKAAVLQMQDAQKGDVTATYADIARAQRDFGFAPSTTLQQGIPRFVEWYKAHLPR